MGVGAAARAHMRLLLCSGHATAAAAAAAQAAATGGGALATFSAASLLYVCGVCCCSAACLCDRCLAALMMLLHLSAFPQTQSPKHKTKPPPSQQQQSIANREAKTLNIELDDLRDYLAEVDPGRAALLDDVKGNTMRYVGIAAEAADDAMPPPEGLPQADIFDRLLESVSNQRFCMATVHA